MIRLPDFFLLFAGRIGDMLRKTGIKTDLSLVNMRQLIIREFYTGKKADENLHLPQFHLENAIIEAINWINIKKKV